MQASRGSPVDLRLPLTQMFFVETVLSQAEQPKRFGVVAQLGERVNGIHEVSGSIPLGSTISPQ
jgi:hypothetical protein